MIELKICHLMAVFKWQLLGWLFWLLISLMMSVVVIFNITHLFCLQATCVLDVKARQLPGSFGWLSFCCQWGGIAVFEMTHYLLQSPYWHNLEFDKHFESDIFKVLFNNRSYFLVIFAFVFQKDTRSHIFPASWYSGC